MTHVDFDAFMNWRTQDDLVCAMAQSLDEAKRVIDDMRRAGDKMAETLDANSDMMQSDGVDVSRQRALTKDWAKAKATPVTMDAAPSIM